MIKKWKLNFTILAYVVLLFLIVSKSYALPDLKVGKAKEFMAKGMFSQAVIILEEVIHGNASDAEAQFLLGVCYINQRYLGPAYRRFANAIELNPDYGYQIGKEHKKAGDLALKKGSEATSLDLKRRENSQALYLYNKALEYTPSLRKEIAQSLFERGKKDESDHFFSLAISYDRSVVIENIADYYYGKSKRPPIERRVKYLKLANKHSNGKFNAQLGEVLLKMANYQNSMETRKGYVEEASKYVIQWDIFESSVEFYTKLWEAPKKFELNNDKWMVIHPNTEEGFEVQYLASSEIEVQYGSEKKIWEAAVLEHRDKKFKPKETSGPLKIRKKTVNTVVYVWINQASLTGPHLKDGGSLIVKRCDPSVVTIYIYLKTGGIKQGSGFFIEPGIIATNYHVVEGFNQGTVTTIEPEKKYRITNIINYDKWSDVALIKVDGTDAPVLPVDTAAVYKGDRIYAFGSPKGLKGTVSDGLISRIGKTQQGLSYYQISVPITKGSSGGPVLNTKGRVIALVVGEFEGKGNLNFAIPIVYVINLLRKAGSPQTIKVGK